MFGMTLQILDNNLGVCGDTDETRRVCHESEGRVHSLIISFVSHFLS